MAGEVINGYDNDKASKYWSAETSGRRIFADRSCDLDGHIDGRNDQSAGCVRAGHGLDADVAGGHDRQATGKRIVREHRDRAQHIAAGVGRHPERRLEHLLRPEQPLRAFPDWDAADLQSGIGWNLWNG